MESTLIKEVLKNTDVIVVLMYLFMYFLEVWKCVLPTGKNLWREKGLLFVASHCCGT